MYIPYISEKPPLFDLTAGPVKSFEVQKGCFLIKNVYANKWLKIRSNKVRSKLLKTSSIMLTVSRPREPPFTYPPPHLPVEMWKLEIPILE